MFWLKKVQIPIKNIKIFHLEKGNYSNQKKEIIPIHRKK
jgi:hypothetical protein